MITKFSATPNAATGKETRYLWNKPWLGGYYLVNRDTVASKNVLGGTDGPQGLVTCAPRTLMSSTKLTRNAEGWRSCAFKQALWYIILLGKTKDLGKRKVVQAMMPVYQLLLEQC
jgi:hypothetical protein